MTNLVTVSIDLETTGLSPQENGICSIACVDADGPFVNLKCNPGDVIIDPKAMEVNGLDIEELRNEVTISELDDLLVGAFDARYDVGEYQVLPLGWNVGSFDAQFIARFLPKFYTRFSYRSIDLNSISYFLAAKYHYPYEDVKENYKSAASAVLNEEMGISENWHDALFDATHAMMVYTLMLGAEQAAEATSIN